MGDRDIKGSFESPDGKYLIFKGGTALRLVYGSSRFSEDLDFSLMKDKLKGNFSGLIKRFAQYPALSITDLKEKYYTYLGEIKNFTGLSTSAFQDKD